MPALEPVVATLVANTEEFTASLEEAKAQMTGLSADAKLAGEESGGAFGTGLGRGAKGAEADLQDTAGATEEAGAEAEKSGKKFSLLGNALSNMGGPLGEAHAKTNEFSHTLEEAGSSGGGFLSMIGEIPTPVTVAVAAVAGIAAVSIDAASKYQTATNQIAATEGITTAAAAKVGAAFLTTAGQTTYSGQQIAEAFAGIAGQAKAIAGHALTAKQSLDLMNGSMALAEASGTDLGGATSTVTKTLQAFQLGLGQSSMVANALLVAAQATGQNVSTLGNQLDKTKTKLGGMSPPLQELTGLLLDMTEHGETGRAAMQSLTTSFQSFLKPTEAVVAAHAGLQIALKNLPPSLDALAKRYNTGKMTAKEATAATQGLTTAQSALWSAFTKASDAVRTSNVAQETLGITTITSAGKMVPMVTIIAQLHDKIKGMNTAQATAVLSAMGLKNASAKLVETIQAGPAVYAKDVKAIEARGAAQKAAEKATAGLHASLEKAKAGIEDAAVALGNKMLPAVTAAAKGIAKFIEYVAKHWSTISAAFGDAWRISAPIFKGMIEAFKGIVGIITNVVQFVENIFEGKWSAAWKNVGKIVSDFVAFVNGTIETFLGSFVAMFGKALDHVVKFFASLPGRALAAVSSFNGMLIHWITLAMENLKNWVIHQLDNVVSFFASLPGRAISALASFGSMIVGWITSAFSFLYNALTNGIATVVSFFEGLPGKILNTLAGAGRWLWDIGKKIIEGLYGGLKSAWNDVTGWLSGLGSIISSIKGPPAKDAVLLHENGRLIMQGLGSGLKDGWSQHVLPLLGGMNSAIQGSISSAGSGHLSIGGVGGTGGGGSSIILQVTTPFNIDGRTIATAVTKYQLQGARATGNVAGRYAGGSQTGSATGINPNAITR